LIYSPRADRIPKDVTDYLRFEYELASRTGDTKQLNLLAKTAIQLKQVFPEAFVTTTTAGVGSSFSPFSSKAPSISPYFYTPSTSSVSTSSSKSSSFSYIYPTSLSYSQSKLSKSISVSSSSSLSQSLSQSFSQSASRSLSKSVSKSISQSMSPSISVSKSISQSMSPSMSKSQSKSPSFSFSYTPRIIIPPPPFFGLSKGKKPKMKFAFKMPKLSKKYQPSIVGIYRYKQFGEKIYEEPKFTSGVSIRSVLV